MFDVRFRLLAFVGIVNRVVTGFGGGKIKFPALVMDVLYNMNLYWRSTKKAQELPIRYYTILSLR